MKRVIRRFRKALRLTKAVFQIIATQNRKRFILVGSPLHGNLGDHAISIAERAFLSEHFKDTAVVEIAGADFRYYRKWLPRKVHAKDRILITGGGFMGSLWLNEEEMIRQVIRSFPDNPVFILPQTIYYDDDSSGVNELNKSRKIYGGHKNLSIFLREKRSYDFVKVHFPDIKMAECVPDMVLYLKLEASGTGRKGILTCFREDREKAFDQIQQEQLINSLREKYGKIVSTTTVLDRMISFGERKKIFYRKLKEFQCSRLVVTDRLHGMLFAAITGTPCIAVDNLSGKIRGVYEWISYLEYVKFAQSIEEVMGYADLLFPMGSCSYDNDQLRYSLERIAERMKESE